MGLNKQRFIDERDREWEALSEEEKEQRKAEWFAQDDEDMIRADIESAEEHESTLSDVDYH